MGGVHCYWTNAAQLWKPLRVVLFLPVRDLSCGGLPLGGKEKVEKNVKARTSAKTQRHWWDEIHVLFRGKQVTRSRISSGIKPITLFTQRLHNITPMKSRPCDACLSTLNKGMASQHRHATVLFQIASWCRAIKRDVTRNTATSRVWCGVFTCGMGRTL